MVEKRKSCHFLVEREGRRRRGVGGTGHIKELPFCNNNNNNNNNPLG